MSFLRRPARAVGLFVLTFASMASLPRDARGEPEKTGENANANTIENGEWQERDALAREASARSGGVGLLTLQHAQSGAPGQLRISFTSEYFSAGFLCSDAFPCRDPATGGKVTSDSLTHAAGTLSLGATITKWLEVYASVGATSNSDHQNRPALLPVLGDTNLGAKVFAPVVGRWLNVGGDVELWLVNGTGSVGLDGSGTSAKFRGLATADLRSLEKSAPLRFTLNGTYSLDNTGDVLASTEASRGAPVTRIERLALGVNRVDHFDWGVGGEAFVLDGKIRPFLEYNMLVPINRQGYKCKANNPSGDHCLENDPVVPSKLTLGGRFYPWKPGLSLTAALDIGITGTSTFIEELAPQAPWTLYIAAGWGFDTWDRPPIIQVKSNPVEIKPPARGHIRGLVHEMGKTDGIADAIVAFEGHPDLTSLATGVDGRFATSELSEGAWTFAVRADGYKDGKCGATLTKSGAEPGEVKDEQVDCPLEALPRVGTIAGRVRDFDTRAAVGNTSIKLVDSSGKEHTAASSDQGVFRLDAIPAGKVTITATADAYLTEVQSVDVKPRTENAIEINIKHRPKEAQVAVTTKEITIKQQVQFATGSAEILPASTMLLTEIADTFLRNPRIKRVEIQGHTDSDGTDASNQTLSEGRANAVRTWLVEHGVAGERLVAKGYGESRPLVPNVIANTRQRNRRVQFVIMEQDAATP